MIWIWIVEFNLCKVRFLYIFFKVKVGMKFIHFWITRISSKMLWNSTFLWLLASRAQFSFSSFWHRTSSSLFIGNVWAKIRYATISLFPTRKSVLTYHTNLYLILIYKDSDDNLHKFSLPLNLSLNLEFYRLVH